ncbi:helix-turn-helix domain-containing protein [Hungatella hathewayi]|uniref:helix-turn-helix domain-containing protein n=1 Tax=Hungatella hathewayi TaxID=154046 RepID=UPI0035649CC7
MSGIPRMRTIQQCAAYLKEQDPGSCIGEWCIRQMVNRGEIPIIRSGRKILVNLDMLIEYLSGEETEAGKHDNECAAEMGNN